MIILKHIPNANPIFDIDSDKILPIMSILLTETVFFLKTLNLNCDICITYFTLQMEGEKKRERERDRLIG